MGLIAHVAAVLLVFLSSCICLQAKEVSLDRIMSEHRITVVTTETPDSISRYLLDLGIRNPRTTTLVELMISHKNLTDGDSLLFLIDRKKTRRLIPEEERLLPCRTSAMNADEVVLYAAKAHGRNGWDILISAPNEKWLRWELDRLTKSGLSYLQLQARGTILERFKVRQLAVVTTEGKQVVADWIAAQNTPGKDTIDWEYFPADEWDGELDGSGDTLFILNTHSLVGKTLNQLSGYLPRQAREWLDNAGHGREHFVGKQTLRDENGGSRVASVIAAPGSRHLGIALGRYPKLDSIPESSATTRLIDLREYRRMIVVARFGDRDESADPKLINDLAANLTSALSGKTGFECVNRQDIKELALETYLNQLPDNERFPERGALAVAVVDLSSIVAETSYAAGNPRCITPVLPAFSDPQPQEPREPQPNDKPLFSSHKYDVVNGSRANDPKYIRDHKDWRDNKMPAYRDALARWERNRRDHETRRREHDMEWVTTISKRQRVEATGNLRIYDLRSGDVEDAGEIVFSCPVTGTGSRESVFKEERSVVRGEDSRPQAVRVPETAREVSDGTVIAEALRSACVEAVKRLLETSLLPVDGVAEGGSGRRVEL